MCKNIKYARSAKRKVNRHRHSKIQFSNGKDKNHGTIVASQANRIICLRKLSLYEMSIICEGITIFKLN